MESWTEKKEIWQNLFKKVWKIDNTAPNQFTRHKMHCTTVTRKRRCGVDASSLYCFPPFFSVLGFEPRASCLLYKCSTIEYLVVKKAQHIFPYKSKSILKQSVYSLKKAGNCETIKTYYVLTLFITLQLLIVKELVIF